MQIKRLSLFFCTFANVLGIVIALLMYKKKKKNKNKKHKFIPTILGYPIADFANLEERISVEKEKRKASVTLV